MYFVSSPGIDEAQNPEQYAKVQRFSKVYGRLRVELNDELKAELTGRAGAYYTETVERTLLALPTVLSKYHRALKKLKSTLQGG